MRLLLGSTLAALVFCLGASADDKIDAKKLVGKWHPEKKKEVVIEFAKDGKLAVTVSGDKELKIEGVYKLDGNKLTTTLKGAGKEKTDTLTISKLTDTELVAKDEKGKEDTLVRIKDK